MHGEAGIYCGVEYGNLKIWVCWKRLRKNVVLVQHALTRSHQKQCEIHGVESTFQGTTDMICCGCGGEM